MSGSKINKAQRQAAGHACITLFGICNTLSFSLRQIAAIDPPTGEGMGRGLTSAEQEYVRKLATTFHQHGEILRKLGWRFRGVNA